MPIAYNNRRRRRYARRYYGNYTSRYNYGQSRLRTMPLLRNSYTKNFRQRFLRSLRSGRYFPYFSSRNTIFPKTGNPYGIELKSTDFLLEQVGVTGGAPGGTNNYYIVPLNITDPGVALGQRVGIKQVNHSVLVRMNITNTRRLADTAALTTPMATQLVRAILFWDKQPSAITEASSLNYPTLADLLQVTVTTTMQPAMYPINLYNGDRFKIVRDWEFYMGGTDAYWNGTTAISSAPNASNHKYISEYIKLGNVESVFTDGGPAGTLRSNCLYIMFIPGKYVTGVTGTNQQTIFIDLHSRVRFYDG